MRKDVYVQVTDDLPMRVRGVTIEMEDGTYVTLINGRLMEYAKANAAAHEFDHIASGDFAGMSADLIEAVAHGRATTAGNDVFIVNGGEMP